MYLYEVNFAAGEKHISSLVWAYNEEKAEELVRTTFPNTTMIFRITHLQLDCPKILLYRAY
jgi:hypothetical protein